MSETSEVYMWVSESVIPPEFTELDVINSDQLRHRIVDGWKLIAILGEQQVQDGRVATPFNSQDQYGNPHQGYFDVPVVYEKRQFLVGRTTENRDLAERLSVAERDNSDLSHKVEEARNTINRLNDRVKSMEETVDHYSSCEAQTREKLQTMEHALADQRTRLRLITEAIGTERVDEIVGLRPCGCIKGRHCDDCFKQP